MALEIVAQENKGLFDQLVNLAQSEPEGFDFMISYLRSVRDHEYSKATTEAAKINGYKGYVPAESAPGIDLRIADDSDRVKLELIGFTRIGDYDSPFNENGRKGYYFSVVSGNQSYSQGVMQTVQKTANGVDIKTGRTVNGMTGGVLPKGSVARVQKYMSTANRRAKQDTLLPIYNAKGQLVAYERAMRPEHLDRLQKNTRMDQMLGAWAGRQTEEALAEEFNQELVRRIKTRWDADKLSRRGEYGLRRALHAPPFG